MNGMKGLLIFAVLLNCFNGIYSSLTVEELTQMMTSFRVQCQAQTGASDDLIDGINVGQFPRDQNLMCYINCLLTMMRMIRKGKFNSELAVKNINMFLPEFMREEWLRGVAACKDHGEDIVDQCERIYSKIECFSRNNEHFIFP
ncbi:general odorant-binding protein 72-like [Sitodiplosis mosellana]|uniref:general odorant-binding protein 72-like n=1 Tax=Sitodiplosis mosellana TaxID=263140 RepID=UPI0024446132|nr:general odorant-binding protein 72-like [Sitodiplosis mosellana]